jgi:predicted ATP-binding protein involved in virulence
MPDRSPPLLTQVTVKNLFGHLNHHVAFPADWDFIILHGVNGIGKTKVLDLIRSALVGNLRRLALIPFTSATLAFHDRSTVEIQREVTARLNSDFLAPEDERPKINFVLSRPGRKAISLSTSDTIVSDEEIRVREYVERYTPLVAVDDDMFFDPSTSETISTEEAADRYLMNFPPTIRRRIEEQTIKVRPELKSYWQSSNVHLIETQRLLRNEIAPPGRRLKGERSIERVSTVAKFSDDAAARIQRALSDLGRESQELDRTFPSRLVQAPDKDAPSEGEVRQRYDEQLKLRRRLTRISVLNAFGADLQLPKEALHPVVLRVMTEFLSDSEKKFRVVEPLLDRLELLTTVLNAKFQYKKIEVDRTRGFVVRTQDGTLLRPNQLSSGEQHELVLLYDLLFGAADNALVLIDEPEISLHVNWQKRFLSDLQEISGLTHHRFVVATHSPNIVGKYSDRMVRLGGS